MRRRSCRSLSRMQAGTCSRAGRKAVRSGHACRFARRGSKPATTSRRSLTEALVGACGGRLGLRAGDVVAISEKAVADQSGSVVSCFFGLGRVARPPAEPLRQALAGRDRARHPRDDAARDRRGRAETDPGGLGRRRRRTPRRRERHLLPGRRAGGAGDRRADSRHAAARTTPTPSWRRPTRTAWPRPCPRGSRNMRAGSSRWRSSTRTTGGSTFSGRASPPRRRPAGSPSSWRGFSGTIRSGRAPSRLRLRCCAVSAS